MYFLNKRFVIKLQEGGPLPGPELGSCLTLRNELSKEIHMLIKQEILLRKGTGVENSIAREIWRAALPHGSWSKGLSVKATVSLVVMYRCEIWTIKKVNAEELMLLNWC